MKQKRSSFQKPDLLFYQICGIGYNSLSEFISLKMPKAFDAKIMINNNIAPSNIIVSMLNLPKLTVII